MSDGCFQFKSKCGMPNIRCCKAAMNPFLFSSAPPSFCYSIEFRKIFLFRAFSLKLYKKETNWIIYRQCGEDVDETRNKVNANSTNKTLKSFMVLDFEQDCCGQTKIRLLNLLSNGADWICFASEIAFTLLNCLSRVYRNSSLDVGLLNEKAINNNLFSTHSQNFTNPLFLLLICLWKGGRILETEQQKFWLKRAYNIN